METKIKEYGGFLPIELILSSNSKDCYYNKYNLLLFNTVKAAIPLIKDDLKSEDIFIPYYLCPNVIAEIKKNFKNTQFYNINNNLLPVLDNLDGKIIYLVNYFGIMDKLLRKYVSVHKNTVFIIDNAHSFYFKPIIRQNVYNLYSCKKFFGVPDGGYLIASKKIENPYKESYSNSISNYLIKSFEEGTNSCYSEKKEIDEFINKNYSGISIFSKKLLSLIDYKKIKIIRKRNFKIYNNAFKNINKIKCENGSIPYLYPLNVGKNIKQELINNKIYVPTLWNMESEKSNIEFELNLKDYTIFLPLDQRYDKNDILYIINKVKSILEK